MMIEIVKNIDVIRDGARCYILNNLTKEEIEELDKICSYVISKVFFIKANLKKRIAKLRNKFQKTNEETSKLRKYIYTLSRIENWDARERYFNAKEKSFPSGLFYKVIEYFERKNYKVEVSFRKLIPELSEVSLSGINLRNYQLETIRTAISSQIGIISAATGTGKTEIAAGIFSLFPSKNRLFLVHRRDLLYQAKSRFELRLNQEIGQIGDGITDIRPITIATNQTLARVFNFKFKIGDWEEETVERDRKKLMRIDDIRQFVSNDVDIVIQDEAHRLTGDSIYNTFMAASKAQMRFVMSATPYREIDDDFQVEAAAGKIIVDIKLSDMIEQKFLVPVQIRFVHLEEKKKKDGYLITKDDRNWFKVIQDEIVNNEELNSLIIKFAREFSEDLEMSTLITVDRVEHGKKLAENIPKSVFLYGGDEAIFRQEIYDAFRERKLKCLISTLISEGVDFPAAQVLIMASAGKSRAMALQKIGRVLRPYQNKDVCFVIDFWHSSKFLSRHSLRRFRCYREEKCFDVA